MNRTIFDLVRTMLHHCQLGVEFWPYAALHAVHVLNHRIVGRTGQSAIEAYTGSKPNVDRLHVFGCTVYFSVLGGKKLDARARRGGVPWL